MAKAPKAITKTTAKSGAKPPMPMKGAQPRVGKMPVKAHTKAGMHGKGMVAPPARKAK